MHNVIQDLRFAARSFRRSPRFALPAILALALGIGATSSSGESETARSRIWRWLALLESV